MAETVEELVNKMVALTGSKPDGYSDEEMYDYLWNHATDTITEENITTVTVEVPGPDHTEFYSIDGSHDGAGWFHSIESGPTLMKEVVETTIRYEKQ
jgi:hypothetical protein